MLHRLRGDGRPCLHAYLTTYLPTYLSIYLPSYRPNPSLGVCHFACSASAASDMKPWISCSSVIITARCHLHLTGAMRTSCISSDWLSMRLAPLGRMTTHWGGLAFQRSSGSPGNATGPAERHLVKTALSIRCK